MNRIICTGNSFFSEDSAGPRVYAYLSRLVLPDNCQLIDGGLCGLNLMHFLNDSARLVFVDSISGFGSENEVIVFKPEDIITNERVPYDHGAGLMYLLHAIPHIYEGILPLIYIVGIEGVFPTKKTIESAASAALACAGGFAYKTQKNENSL